MKAQVSPATGSAPTREFAPWQDPRQPQGIVRIKVLRRRRRANAAERFDDYHRWSITMIFLGRGGGALCINTVPFYRR